MDKLTIIETVNRLFIAVDGGDWEAVRTIFDDTVLLDYTSMAGGVPATLTSGHIIEAWQGVLPGFDHTHHQLGNFVVTTGAAQATLFCYGTATHYLQNDSGNNIWTVVGSYAIELEEKAGNLRITKMKFTLKYIDGNSDLVGMAKERIKQ